ncbi:hypothetical protein [Absidia glauca]|uniref:Integrase zinc-binding domain-containing protein n=1 Tax=Absidia glauca TaxID=4829 RepID=A0A168LN25_ABSGL|nr:hypothetical protein [Absidia glauca]
MRLQQYHYQVIYVPGPKNLAADALSRHPLPSVNNVSTSLAVDWPKLQQQDSHIQTLMMSMKKAKCPEGLKRTYTVANDLLFHIIPATRNKARNRLLLVIPISMHSAVLQDYYSSIWAGHFGIRKTLQRILQAGFWWPDLHPMVKEFVKSCKICQHTKTSIHYDTQPVLTLGIA